ncbi:MAG: extracellular solute-binding protein [Firmicutes bacterium]|nr:extracellular solute-binding protein [Bacillota bacterium]
MKKLLTVLFALLIVTVAACSSDNGGESNKLVLYTSTADDNLAVMIPAFEEEYGIEVEVVTAGTGEIYSRIQAETNNPYADVTWIGEYYVVSDTSYFEEYVSPEDEFMGDFKNTSGYVTLTGYNVPVILYNKNLVDFEITSYEDLLHPDLFGKIAMGNAAASSSAYNHLENMLLAMGNGDPFDEAAWQYVEDFYRQLDGRIVDSSGTIHSGVVSGEYAVGMTWDTPAQTYLSEGIEHIGVVYMDEGVVPKTAGIAVIKDAKNMENAKRFADFMASEYGQSLLGTEVTGANPLRPGVDIADYKQDINEVKTIQITSEWSAEQQPDIIDRYTDLYLSIFE